MAINQLIKEIRPEDGWVSCGGAPIVFGIYPTLKHYWYIAISATKPPEDYPEEICMPDKKKPFLSQEYSGLLDSTDQIWIRIKEPPNQDHLTKLAFKIWLAS